MQLACLLNTISNIVIIIIIVVISIVIITITIIGIIIIIIIVIIACHTLQHHSKAVTQLGLNWQGVLVTCSGTASSARWKTCRALATPPLCPRASLRGPPPAARSGNSSSNRAAAATRSADAAVKLPVADAKVWASWDSKPCLA